MEDITIGRDEEDRKTFGKDGTILLGKHYVKMGQNSSLANNVMFDMVRPHVVMLCGKRGGGKCLHGDTIITLNDGSEIKIKDLEKNDKDILCLNDRLKIQKARKEGFYKRKVKKLLKIRLRSGKTIKVTPEHPLLTVSGWKKAEEIGIKGRIATPRKVNYFGNNHIEEEKVKILAYLIAEGHLGNKKILFSNQDKKIVKDFKDSINTFDNTLHVNNHGKDCYSTVHYAKKIIIEAKRDLKGRFTKGTIFKKTHSLRKYLYEIGLYEKNSFNKFIPNEIFTSTKSNISLFLNRLFSCDGTIYFDSNKNQWRISYCSVSKKLILQVQSLLLRFGIRSIIRKKITYTSHCFELEISHSTLRDYMQNIGFFGKKEKRMKKALAETEERKYNPNLDTIPKEIWQHYKPDSWTESGKALMYSHPKALRESTKYCPSRKKLALISLQDRRCDILQLALSDIYWDEIIDVKELEGDFYVYDITVPEHHNFVANNIIVHNSYTLGVMAEGLADMPTKLKKNISIILLDTMGVYWTMKYENHKEAELLRPYKLEPKGFDVKIFTPKKFYEKYKEQGIPTDYPFSIKPSELESLDWCLALNINMTDEIGVLLEKIVMNLKKSSKDYSIDDMIQATKNDKTSEQKTKDALINRLLSTEAWGLFDEKGTPMSSLARSGEVVVLDVSCYATMENGWNVKSLVVGMISQKMFIERMLHRKNEEYDEINKTRSSFGLEKKKEKTQDVPLVWLVIDEAHEFLPREGKTAASSALITILREGRQPGISLILATQQPAKIHTDVMTQADTVIAHRLTAKIDTEALSILMQSYMRKGLDVELDTLPRLKGTALIFDDTNEKLYQIRIRPRMSWHGGSSPTALEENKTE